MFGKWKSYGVRKATRVRHHYRSAPPESLGIKVSVFKPSVGPFQGEVVDLTAGGVAVRFTVQKHPSLAIDNVVEVTVSSTKWDGEIVTPARVAYFRRDGEAKIRYGFEFINRGDLYRQLDAFYVRVFNRRKALRVLPDLDRKVPATISFGGVDYKATLHDISVRGAGLILSHDCAEKLPPVDAFEIGFQLPGTKKSLSGRAFLRNRMQLPSTVLVGLEFDLDGNFGRCLQQLEKFVDQRVEETAKWEAAWA